MIELTRSVNLRPGDSVSKVGAVNAFIDPRGDPCPRTTRPSARTTKEPEEVTEFHRLCRDGRLYDVERWIQADRPLQIAEGTPVKRSRVTSAIEIAVEKQNHALVLLLLCNGYDTNREQECPMDLALRARRWDLLDLLLSWGADPQRADLSDLFDTYNSALFERFRSLGVDLTAGHALAAALAHHTSNKPLYGFAKRHARQDPKIHTELNMALAHHADKGNEKGVQLCLWAGADPHAPVPSLRYSQRYEEDETDEADRFLGHTAIYEACSSGNLQILELLGPDPALDDFEQLYRWAHNGAIIEFLARSALPKEIGPLIQHHLWWLTVDFGGCQAQWRSLDALRRIFQLRVRWEVSSAREIANIRQLLLKTSDEVYVDLMKLLALNDSCSSEILQELARTPSMRARMKKVGFIPPSPDDPRKFDRPRPTRSPEILSKFGIEGPKPVVPPVSLPSYVQIGIHRPNGREIRLDRASLFERVWSEPVENLAAEWGLSGRGLSKACRRLLIPVPPRGFWAKLKVGQRMRRPRLPEIKAHEAQVIVIWAPA